ncbi:hypothetical protein O6H91_12G011100 [Diphasiastrum complanatum]|uniref:Uncharacterized protein n=1 Tax=Diphasiastrum complanatum TaxID=34168 RepID=A0ACC2BZD2_DIPCM|nr:hypothetical protein O6H91_12G011100 [Diphasiastrum complanatum]
MDRKNCSVLEFPINRSRRLQQSLLMLLIVSMSFLVLGAQNFQTEETIENGVFPLTRIYSNNERSTKQDGVIGMTDRHWELLKTHDMGRFRRLANIAELPLGGSADPFIAGLYFTQLALGTPPTQYYVQVDTGSDLLWLNCEPCNGCPSSSDLGISLKHFDPKSSASSVPIPCTDFRCGLVSEVSEAGCNLDQTCGYSFEYGDGSKTDGYLIEDVLQYEQLAANSLKTNTTATITFGCGFNQSGDLSSSERAMDGIMGFGPNSLSVPVQLARQKKIPKKFAHCLEGSSSTGGILVLGNVIEPGISYTPLVPNSIHYNVNLQNISVNGVNLSIDTSVFQTSDTRGTIFDSGTTLAYLVDEAFGPLVTSIIAAANAQVVSLQGNVCFVVLTSVDTAFPNVTLFFEGARLDLKPRDYLLQQASAENAPIWCMGWQPTGSANTPLHYSVLGGSGSVLVSTDSGQTQSIRSSTLIGNEGEALRTTTHFAMVLAFLAVIILV